MTKKVGEEQGGLGWSGDGGPELPGLLWDADGGFGGPGAHHLGLSAAWDREALGVTGEGRILSSAQGAPDILQGGRANIQTLRAPVPVPPREGCQAQASPSCGRQWPEVAHAPVGKAGRPRNRRATCWLARERLPRIGGLESSRETAGPWLGEALPAGDQGHQGSVLQCAQAPASRWLRPEGNRERGHLSPPGGRTVLQPQSFANDKQGARFPPAGAWTSEVPAQAEMLFCFPP